MTVGLVTEGSGSSTAAPSIFSAEAATSAVAAAAVVRMAVGAMEGGAAVPMVVAAQRVVGLRAGPWEVLRARSGSVALTVWGR